MAEIRNLFLWLFFWWINHGIDYMDEAYSRHLNQGFPSWRQRLNIFDAYLYCVNGDVETPQYNHFAINSIHNILTCNLSSLEANAYLQKKKIPRYIEWCCRPYCKGIGIGLVTTQLRRHSIFINFRWQLNFDMNYEKQRLQNIRYFMEQRRMEMCSYKYQKIQLISFYCIILSYACDFDIDTIENDFTHNISHRRYLSC